MIEKNDSFENCIKSLDMCIRRINDITYMLSGRLLIQDIDKYMAVKQAEHIVNEVE